MNCKSLALLLAAVMLPVGGVAADSSMAVANGGMETRHGGSVASWSAYYPPGAETTATVTSSDNAHSGKGSILLDWQSGMANFGASSAEIKVSGGQLLSLSAWCKTSDSGLAQLLVRAFDAKGNLVMEEISPEKSFSDKWGELAVSFATPKTASRLTVYCLNKGEGKVWCDDVKVGVLSPDSLKSSPVPIRFGLEPAEGNANWNNGKAVFNTFVDSPCSLTLDVWGDKTKLKNPALVIELPAEITVAECFSSHPNTPSPTEKATIESFIRDGSNWKRYVYIYPKVLKLINVRPSFCRTLTMLFKPVGSHESISGKTFPARCYFVNDGKNGEARDFFIHMLPPMKHTANPSRYRVFVWNNFDIAVTDKQLLNSILRRFDEAGMTAVNTNAWGRKEVMEMNKLYRDRDWQSYTMMGSNVFYQPVLKAKGNSELAKLWNGKSKDATCPSFQLSDEGRTIVKSAMSGILKDVEFKDGDWALFDYEPWQSGDWCYCDKCLKRFADFAGLETVPDIATVRNKYQTQWADFRTRDTADIVKNAVDDVKSMYPAARISDYDYVMDYADPDIKKRFWSIPKDSRITDKVIDSHMQSYYYIHDKDAFVAMDRFKTFHSKPMMVFSLIARRSDPDQTGYARTIKETLTPGQFRLVMLDGASAGAIGHSIFPGNKIDGEYFSVIDATMAEIAEVEDLYRDGKRIDNEITVVPEWSSRLSQPVNEFFAFRAQEFDGRMAVTLFNFSPVAGMNCKVSFNKTGNFVVKSVSGNKVIKSPAGDNVWRSEDLTSGIKLAIPPHSAVVLSVTPAN